LAKKFSGGVCDGPDGGVLNPKPFPRTGNANAAIVIDVALDSDFLEETIAMNLGKGFGGEARR
jgi:hypothetical protein